MATVATIDLQANFVAGTKVPTNRGSQILAVDSNKSDTEFLPVTVRGFRVNAAGNVAFTVRDDTDALTNITRAFTAGQVWDLCPVYRVLSTGTTATGIDGYY